MTKWSLSKPKRQRRRNGTNKRSNDPEQWHVRYKSWYISWSFRVLCKQRSQNLRHVSQFLNLLFELNSPFIFIFQIVPTVIEIGCLSSIERFLGEIESYFFRSCSGMFPSLANFVIKQKATQNYRKTRSV